MKNISDVCLSVCSGGTPSKKEETYYLNGTIPWLNTGEVNFNRIRKTENYITQKGLDNSSAKWVPENTVIVAMYGATASKCAIAKIPLTTNQACCNLIINNKLADYRFIYYSLKLRSKELASLANGGAQQNLNAGDIKNFEIKIPNLTTQTKIADALSIFDDKIENNNNLIKNLIEQSMSIWSLLFDESQYDDKKGWRKVFLSDITENIRERVNGRELKVLSALNSGRLMPSEEYFTKQVFSKEIDKYIVVRQNDFAYNPARINIGSIGINDLGFDGCVSPVYVVFRVENGYEHYFNIFIKTTRFKKEASNRSSGSVRQSLNYDDFGRIQISYPPIPIVDRFNEVYIPLLARINELKQENVKLEQMRDALMQKIFNTDFDIDKIDLE